MESDEWRWWDSVTAGTGPHPRRDHAAATGEDGRDGARTGTECWPDRSEYDRQLDGFDGYVAEPWDSFPSNLGSSWLSFFFFLSLSPPLGTVPVYTERTVSRFGLIHPGTAESSIIAGAGHIL